MNVTAARAEARPFLTARWSHLALLNYPIDPARLEPYVPAGTELDLWSGRAYVSLVGFLFLDTRVLGVGIPGHRDFEEVNLRFYVRRQVDQQWRRGVVFIKELVPRTAIALTARWLYGENYQAVPMSHAIRFDPAEPAAPRQVCYGWQYRRQEHRLELAVDGPPCELDEGSLAEFIVEHYWGYTRRGPRRTLEYQVAHPRWRMWLAREARYRGDARTLYGNAFAACLAEPPASALLAEGSAVTVFRGQRLPL